MRVQRSFEEFRVIDEGQPHDKSTDYLVDTVYHFFQDCYHLKDWLKNDPESAPRVGDIEAEVSNSFALSLCADLANATKHFALKTSRTGDTSTAFGPKHFKLGLGQAATIAVDFEVLSGGSSWDAFNIAEFAMDDWRKYLKRVGLVS